jgi:uncharacterized protein (DUF433 family)
VVVAVANGQTFSPSFNRQRSFPKNWQECIEQNPEVMMGKPCIKGTRLTVEFVLEQLSNGWSIEDLVQNYSLTPEQISAAQGFAAAWLRLDELTLRSG